MSERGRLVRIERTSARKSVAIELRVGKVFNIATAPLADEPSALPVRKIFIVFFVSIVKVFSLSKFY